MLICIDDDVNGLELVIGVGHVIGVCGYRVAAMVVYKVRVVFVDRHVAHASWPSFLRLLPTLDELAWMARLSPVRTCDSATGFSMSSTAKKLCTQGQV